MNEIILGDCVSVMAAMPENSIDAIVCDPPYGLRFMGRKWDGIGGDAMAQIEWHRLWLAEALRVLKPGAHLLAFSGTRTSHFLAMGLEFAGFRQPGDVAAPRDTLSWLFGSGFPKSLDVSKALDKAAGAKRKVVGGNPNGAGRTRNKTGGRLIGGHDEDRATRDVLTAPATDLAAQWEGWGTALKPAWEPCVVARKPLRGTVAANVAEYGTGAINVDATRISSGPTAIMDAWENEPSLCDLCAERAEPNGRPTAPASRASTATSGVAPTSSGRAKKPRAATSKAAIGCSAGLFPAAPSDPPSDDSCSSIAPSGKRRTARSRAASSSTTETQTNSTTASKTCNSCGAPITTLSTGRWPSNVVLDEEAASMLDEQSGIGITNKHGLSSGLGYQGGDRERVPVDHLDSGGASRFFYTAKASRSEREAKGRMKGKLEPKRRTDGREKDIDNPRLRTSERLNDHPTVKPVALMEWLIKLVLPPGGLLLDPFAGSGTTLVAARMLNVNAVGIEMDPRSAKIARERINAQWEVKLL